MKIRLLNDGGFSELWRVKFPIEVEGTEWAGCGFDVHESEFQKLGYGEVKNNDDDNGLFYFSLVGGECEVVE